MAGFTRTVHPSTNFRFATMKELAPDLTITPHDVEPQNGNGQPAEPMGLALFDPDGETHIYVFTAEGKTALIKQLTGGIIVPSSG